MLAVGVNANWYDGLNADSDFNFQNRRAARIAVPLNDYQLSADLNFTYVPMYGKFAGFGDFIFHYDAYVEGGVGLIRTKPLSIIDPDNRSFPTWNNLVNFDLGIGFRIFFNRWLAATLEVRDLIYSEKIENTVMAVLNPSVTKSLWYDTGTHITNDVQLQLGLSFFLPHLLRIIGCPSENEDDDGNEAAWPMGRGDGARRSDAGCLWRGQPRPARDSAHRSARGRAGGGSPAPLS